MKDDYRLRWGDALIVVDVQNDFLPGGNLPVPHGDEVIPVLNRYLERFGGAGLPAVATRDWHPPDHCSFKSRGGAWPQHCVAGTQGAGFAGDLGLPPDVVIISKAASSGKEAYSGLDGTSLDEHLRASGVERVFVGGLATDYCVLNTVKDFLARGYSVVVLVDAIRAVDVEPGDGASALEEMETLGAVMLRFEEIDL